MATAVEELKPYGLSEANAINMSADEYAKQAAAYRKALQQRLLDQGQEQFKQANPFILEDLNARGFATSPSETANTQSRYLADIALKNNQSLSAFDTDAFNQESNLRQQAAMTPLELERMGIERDYALADQARADALARELASQQSKDSMTSGLLGLGGNLLQGGMMAKAVAGKGGSINPFSGLFGGGATGGAAGGSTALAGSGMGLGGIGGAGASGSGALAGTSVGGGLTGSAGLAPGSTLLGGSGGGAGGAGFMSSALPWAGGVGVGFGGGAYAGQKTGNAIFKSKKAEKRARTGATVGAGIGTAAGSIFGPGGAAIGGLAGGQIGQLYGGMTASHFAGQMSQQAKNFIRKPTKTIQNAPKNVAKTVSKAFKKAFCFTPGTMIEMEDGTMKPIESITLGENVNGGKVYSIRMSMTDPGQIYNYLGTNVTGTHAVKESGVWTRVENSAFGIRTDLPGPVISLVTEKHRIHSNGTEFADEFEHDNYEEITMDESLKLLNMKEFSHA